MGFRITQRNVTGDDTRSSLRRLCDRAHIFQIQKKKWVTEAQVGGLHILNRDRSVEIARFAFNYHVRLAAATVTTVVGEAQEREGL